MKSRSEPTSVARIAELLQFSRLLTGDEVEALRLRWHGESTAEEDSAAFARWLVANAYATEFQVSLLLRDRSDRFYLGPYKLLERISRGRMATVYRAVHRLGQTVALKVLPPSRARDSRVLAQFHQEAKLAQPLHHIHIVRTLDCGEERGLHYLVMEYLEGETFQRYLEQRGRLSPDVAGEIIRQALLGLDYLHQQGFVHRHLEPGNLILQRTGNEALPRLTVKILDTSLIRAVSDTSDEAPALVSSPYRAPELASAPDWADIRADIYSLGCVLYVALSGRPPADDPAPLGKVVPDLPDAIERIVGRMLAKDPALRYATPIQAAEALQEFLERSTATPPGGDAEALPVSVEMVAVSSLTPESAFGQVLVEPVLVPRAFDSFWPDQAIGEHPPEWSANSSSGGKVHTHGIDRRDYRMLLMGGIGLLIAELLGWLIAIGMDFLNR